MPKKKSFSEEEEKEEVGYSLAEADMFPEIFPRQYLGCSYSQKRNVTLMENILREKGVHYSYVSTCRPLVCTLAFVGNYKKEQEKHNYKGEREMERVLFGIPQDYRRYRPEY